LTLSEQNIIVNPEMGRVISFSGLPDSLLEWLDAQAKSNLRSRSAEIVAIIRHAQQTSYPDKRSDKTFEFTPTANQMLRDKYGL
jgi:hypothetical protein